MPKYQRFPYLFDEGKTISTMKLREWGYLKKHYAGKPTNRYIKLKNKLKIAESFSAYEMENLYLM